MSASPPKADSGKRSCLLYPPKAHMCSARGNLRYVVRLLPKEKPQEIARGFVCISRSDYVESAWAFRQASARAKRKARTYLRGTGSSLQRFIGDIERKCFFFILYRVVHHGIDPFVRRFHPSASYYYWNSVVGRNRIIDIFILRVYVY